MHHFAWVCAVSNRAYWVVVAIWRSQPIEGGKLFRMDAGASFRMGMRGFQPRLPGWCCNRAIATYRRGKLFRMAAGASLPMGRRDFKPRLPGCCDLASATYRMRKTVQDGRKVHHCPWVCAVSNRAYRVGVAMGRAQPTEGGKLFAMGRAQPIKGGKWDRSVKKFDLRTRVMVCYIRKTFTSLEKFGSTSLKGELSVGALSKRAFTPFSSTSLKGERYAPCKNVRTFVDRYL